MGNARNEPWDLSQSSLPCQAQPRGENQGSLLPEDEKTELFCYNSACRLPADTISNYLIHTQSRKQGPACGQLQFAPCHNCFMDHPAIMAFPGFSEDSVCYYGNHRATWPCIDFFTLHKLSSEGVHSVATWEHPSERRWGGFLKISMAGPGVPHLLLTGTFSSWALIKAIPWPSFHHPLGS